ncbi:MAG TPA: hypothetical protein ACHBZA_15205 [Arsenophonus apicola]|uniref:hypothetical protein n=1 Tax=Arsenophonus apicola TaxID=2879119 RepID=UPI001CDBC420|nr:hypothetical protein [Arsenophonus apicola]UBX29296.1 hypothetical protein LDL57_00905 [Arsenophonus apicola]
MSVWDNFWRLDTLDIGFYDNTSAQRATIYANEKNQVEFYIKVKIVDKNNNPLDIPDKELINNIYLVHYADGNTNLHPWKATSNKNDYAKVVAWNAQLSEPKIETYAGEKMVKYYLSASESNRNLDISAGIYIPGVGQFDTSQNGTNTKNGPRGESGSVFVSPKYKQVKSIPAIDYSKPENIEVKEIPTAINNFKEIMSDGLVQQTNFAWPATGTWHVGQSSKAQFTIHPKLNKNDYVFHRGDPRRNNVNLSTCRFPAAPDMIRGTGGNNFDAQFVFVNRGAYGVLNDSKFAAVTGANGQYEYIIGKNDGRHHWTQTLKYGYITVDICNHRIPWSGMSKLKWSDAGKIIEVDVTDNYGNSGVITISAIKDGNERWPGFYINGQ